MSIRTVLFSLAAVAILVSRFSVMAQAPTPAMALLPNRDIRHFGDTEPLKTELTNLKSKLPELITMNLPRGVNDQNSVTAIYTDAAGVRLLVVIAKAYDSEAVAKAALEQDMIEVSVSPDATESIQGVKIFEYTRYGPGHMRFQVGPYTFDLSGSSWPQLQKVFSVLATTFSTPARR